ncbi:MAG: RIP metalloprotease RseP [Deltaproteobacteria bacterium]|jgi:regulator of sigma E protease|nr:RIP metalloprotease RseP [Deltaproteobacteria bacterium]
MLLTIVSFIFLLVILIFVHELGHFSVAKLLGVRVECFSLGFPPKIVSHKIGETVYQLCWVPIGGFVKLLGDVPGEEISEEDKAVSFSSKPNWAKFLIVFAGPFFNLVFAALVFCIIALFNGESHLSTTLGPIKANSPAALASLKSGDVIKSIDGQEVLYFDQVIEQIENGNGSEAVLRVERDGREFEARVKPVSKEGKTLLGDPFFYWSLELTPRLKPYLGQVQKGRPAEMAGLKKGDLVTAIDGQSIDDFTQLTEIVLGPESQRASEKPQKRNPLTITVLRDNQLLDFSVTPEAAPQQGLDGKTSYSFLIGVTNSPQLLVESLGPIRALGAGLNQSWKAVELTYLTVVKLLQNKISAKLMGGPILIAEVAGQGIRGGLDKFFALMALISVNLAIINLFPVPVLDGGQMVIFIIEGIRRKPLNERVKGVGHVVGWAALICLMVLVFYNDISRIVTRLSGPPTEVVETIKE